MTNVTCRRKSLLGASDSEGECMTIIVGSMEAADWHGAEALFENLHLDAEAEAERANWG